MECNKFDTSTFSATLTGGDTSIIHVESGNVDKAIEIVLREMERIEHPRRFKMSRSDRLYYHYTHFSDVYYDALEGENIKAVIWD